MSDVPRPLPPKKEVALALLEGLSMYVHLDPRRPGVVVPKPLSMRPELVLQLGLNMAIAIPDLKLDDEGLTCTLSFNRSPFWCKLPWSAVYALLGDDGRGMVWPNDVPPEVTLGSSGAAQQPPAKPAKRPRPRAVDAPPSSRNPESVRDAEEGGASDAPAAAREPLVSVPRGPRAAPAPAPARADAVERKVQERPEEAGKKPRRELPPYLRVIK